MTQDSNDRPRDGGSTQRGGRGCGRGRRVTGQGGRLRSQKGPPQRNGAAGQIGRTSQRGGGGRGRTTIGRQPGRVLQLQRPEPAHRHNGEKGAEPHTVSEEYRIKLSNILIRLREDESKNSLEFPADLTNTERKFLHLLASQLGLKSKSSGQGENRKITVSKLASPQTANHFEAIPKLRIGRMGEGSLSDHLSRYPPNQLEIAESLLTGSGLLNDDAQEMLLRNATIPIKPDIDYADRPVNKPRRRQNHAAVQNRKITSTAFNTMLRARAQLPAWSHQDEIVRVVAGNQVTIIVGETGCGKSTQVPQFLLDANPDSYICVTQPRRIAAISIADRVAAEQCDSLLIAHQVRLENNVTTDTQLLFCTPGVLLRKLQSSPKLNEYTHIVLDEVHERDRYQEFLLIILRDLLPSRPDLRLVLMSATLQTVDIFNYFAKLNPATVEMEGRTFPVQEFFLEDALSMTGFVDGIVSALETQDTSSVGKDVKIQCILCGKMGFISAEALGEHVAFCDGMLRTSDDEYSLQNNISHELNADEKSFDVENLVFDDYDVNLVAEIEKNDFALRCQMSDGEDEQALTAGKWDGQSEFDLSRPSEEAVGRAEDLLKQYQSMHDDETIDYFLVLELMRHIIERGDGGILIFLPGWQEISELSAILESTIPFSNRSQFCILSLHSGIHSSEQRRVLQRPPHGVRKVVLATNIAETSLTIDDIVFVIDTGRAKEKNYDPHLKTSTLQTTWISQASAKQRKGRAGRVRSGVCFHLFSKLRHESLRPFTESELLRTPLEEMCLVCKQLHLTPGGQEDDDGIPAFLAKAMNAPHEKSVSNALELLVDLGAMQSDSNDLTSLGECLAVLSLEPRVGKMMIWSYLLGCSRVAANMCVAMTTKSPFVLPRETQRRAAEAAKVQLSNGSESDQLTVHFALETKAQLKNRNSYLDFCRRSFINATTMQMISDLRRNLSRELHRLSFADPTVLNQPQNRHDKEQAVWQAAIVAGLYPNIASRSNGQSNFTTMDKHKVRIHVSSVNSARGQPLGKKSAIQPGEIEFVCFGEIVKGDRLFTANQTTHLVSPLPLLLLCGTQLCVRPKESSSTTAILSVDDWIFFECDATIAGQLVILRRRLNSAFWNTIAHGSLSGLSPQELDAVNILGNVLISAHRSA